MVYSSLWVAVVFYAQNISPAGSKMHGGFSVAMPLASPSSFDIIPSSCSMEMT